MEVDAKRDWGYYWQEAGRDSGMLQAAATNAGRNSRHMFPEVAAVDSSGGVEPQVSIASCGIAGLRLEPLPLQLGYAAKVIWMIKNNSYEAGSRRLLQTKS